MMIILVLVVGAHIICDEIVQWPVGKWKHLKNEKIVLFLGSKNLEVHIYLLHHHAKPKQFIEKVTTGDHPFHQLSLTKTVPILHHIHKTKTDNIPTNDPYNTHYAIHTLNHLHHRKIILVFV